MSIRCKGLRSALIVLLLPLTGCQWLGSGKEGSYIKYTQECSVAVISGAKVEGVDDIHDIESVEIDEQCNASITRDENIN